MPVKVSPTDTARDIRHQQIRSRATNSTFNRAPHITLPGLSFARCPFCGGIGEMSDDEDTGGASVQCKTCFAIGPRNKDQRAAARLWNSRAVSKRRGHGK
jgi:hypothetical protein